MTGLSVLFKLDKLYKPSTFFIYHFIISLGLYLYIIFINFITLSYSVYSFYTDNQSWGIGWVESETEALINSDKGSSENDIYT